MSEECALAWQPGLFDAAFAITAAGSEWEVVSGMDPRALALVDGAHDACEGRPHYSRQHPGSTKGFTGPGRELVLVTRDGLAVWAVTERRKVNSPEWLFRNSVFLRAGGSARASDLIRAAVDVTRQEWPRKYNGESPRAPLTTEVDASKVRHKRDPGRCFIKAGWRFAGLTKRGLLIFAAPEVNS